LKRNLKATKAMTATTRILLLPALLLSLFLGACNTGRNLVESGDYDKAVSHYAHKLRGKKKKKTDHVRGLELAFRKAQNRDLATATALADEGRPENWERVHDLHRQVRRRQNLVAPLLPLRSHDGYAAKIEFVDIAVLENASRAKAAEHLYDRATELLGQAERGDKLAARKAYDHLLDLQKRYFSQYRDKDQMMARARDLGTTYVLFEVKNQSDKVLPRAFAERILAMSKQDLDSEWKEFYFEAKDGVNFDYKAVFKVRNIDISPERVHERAYLDEKDIQDGWNYVLDARGNVKKDSLGNDIKTPRHVRIRANVVEVFQTKAARLAGFVEIHDLYRKTLLDTRDISTEILFENYASTFVGDARALSDQSRVRIGNRPQPFPPDADMLVQAADRLKPSLREELRRSRAIL